MITASTITIDNINNATVAPTTEGTTMNITANTQITPAIIARYNSIKSYDPYSIDAAYKECGDLDCNGACDTCNAIAAEDRAIVALVEGKLSTTNLTATTVTVTEGTEKAMNVRNAREITESVSNLMDMGVVMFTSNEWTKVAAGTVFRTGADDFEYGYVMVKKNPIFVKLLNINAQTLEVPGLGERYAVQLTGNALVCDKLVARRNNLDAGALERDMATIAIKVVVDRLSKRQSTGLGYYGAPGQFGNLPDNVLAIDIIKANQLVKQMYKRAKKLGIDMLGFPKGTEVGYLLHGAEIFRMKREPDTAPNGSDFITIHVVDAGYACIGLNQQTMESLLGDFDFDTLMLSMSFAQESEGLKYIKAQHQKVVSGKMAMPRGGFVHNVRSITNKLSIQTIGALQHFDDNMGAFLRAVATEDKKSIGIFKSLVFWTLGAIYRHSVTKNELLAKATELMTAVDGDTPKTTLHRKAIAQRLALYNANEDGKTAAALAFAVWKMEVYPYEEAVMDALKRALDLTTMKMVPEVKISVAEFLHGTTKSGRLDWEQLESAGYATDCLKLAMRASFVEIETEEGTAMKFSPVSALAVLDPVYAALVSRKKRWINGDVETLLSLLQEGEVLSTTLSVDLRDTEGERMAIDRVTARVGKVALPPMPTYNPGSIVGGGFDAIQSLDGKRILGKRSVVMETVDGVTTILVREPLNGRYTPTNSRPYKENGKPAGWEIPVGEFSVKAFGHGHVIRREGILTNNNEENPRFRYCGVFVGAAQLPATKLDGNTHDLRDSRPTGIYPSNDALRLMKYGFWEKVKMVANAETTLSGAASAVRQAINAMPMVSDNAGAEFLNDFIVLDVPEDVTIGRNDKKVELSIHVRRHLLSVLQARGFDLDASSHATRGREVGVVKENGATPLDPMLWAKLGNKVRFSKGFSTRVNNLPFMASRLTSTVTTVVAAFLGLDEFGIEPGDNTLRTEDGSLALTIKNLPLVEVTLDEFNDFMEDNEESPELTIQAVIKNKKVGPVTVNTYWIPDMDSLANEGAFKLLLGGYIPGLSQPINKYNTTGLLPTRLAAHFTNTITRVDDAKFVIEVIMDERTVSKKGAFNMLTSAAVSQLDEVPEAPKDLESLVCRARAEKVARALKGKADFPVADEFNDYIGLVETALQMEGKASDGRMFLFGIAEDGTLTPVLNERGEHVRALVGHVEASRPRYIAEGSYGSWRKSTTVGIQDRIATGQSLEWNQQDKVAFAIARHNLQVAKKLREEAEAK